MDEALALLEGCLERVIREIPQEDGREMARYALFPGGKRIRPRLLLATSEALGLPLSDDLLLLGSLIEILHSASLVHDDLPALDDDKIRRGKDAAHVKYGEGEAVLLGDLLQSIVFEGIHLLSTRELRATAAIVLGQSNTRLTLGQLEDIKNLNDIDSLRQIHEMKTGALFSAACYLPTFLSDQLSEQEASTYQDLGLEFGVLFQFANDLKDLTKQKESEREAGSDQRNGRFSLEAGDSLEKLSSHINRSIDQLESYLQKVEELHSRFSSDDSLLKGYIHDLIEETIKLLPQTTSKVRNL